MIKKANINWSAKQLTKMIEKGSINFDSAVQRGLCWKDDRKSLLIHSMITGYPIPPMYSAKDEDGYSMLDGRQRSNAISDFINNDFFLTDVPEVETESGELLDLNGKTFNKLPEDIQDDIKDYSLTIYYFDGINEDEITEMFFRLNNGKPLSAIELTRVKAKCLDKIKEIGRHELFTSTLTATALNKYTNEDLVIKSWAILNTENPSFETKEIRPLIENADITDEQAGHLTTAYGRILDTYKLLKVVDDKENNKIAKRVITRTHLLSLIPVALDSTNNNISIEAFTEFVKTFFNGKRSATTSDIYNSTSGSGSATSKSVQSRITAITDAYKVHFKNVINTNNTDKQEDQEEVKPVKKTAKVTPIRDFSGIDDDNWQENTIPHEVMDAYANTML